MAERTATQNHKVYLRKYEYKAASSYICLNCYTPQQLKSAGQEQQMRNCAVNIARIIGGIIG